MQDPNYINANTHKSAVNELASMWNTPAEPVKTARQKAADELAAMWSAPQQQPSAPKVQPQSQPQQQAQQVVGGSVEDWIAKAERAIADAKAEIARRQAEEVKRICQQVVRTVGSDDVTCENITEAENLLANAKWIAQG